MSRDGKNSVAAELVHQHFFTDPRCAINLLRHGHVLRAYAVEHRALKDWTDPQRGEHGGRIRLQADNLAVRAWVRSPSSHSLQGEAGGCF